MREIERRRPAFRSGPATAFRTSSAWAVALPALFLIGLLSGPVSAVNPCTDGWTAFGADTANTGISSSPLNDSLVEAWRYKADGDIYSTPVVAQGRLVVGTADGTVVCLDPLTAEEHWRATLRAGVECSPAFIPPREPGGLGRIVIGDNSGDVSCLELEGGELVWNFTTQGYVKSAPCFVPDPAGYTGRLYFGSYDGAMYCLDSDDGDELWRFPGCDRINPSPAYADGRIYFGACDGVLYCLNADDGRKVWNFTASYFPGSAVVAGGRVFAGSNDNNLYCADATTGAKLWDFDTGGSLFSTPAAQGGHVYVGSDSNRFFCLKVQDGAEKWSVETQGNIRSPPVLADGLLLFGNTAGELLGLDQGDGSERFKTQVEGGIEAGPAVTGGMAFVGTTGGYLYAFTDGSAVAPAEPARAEVVLGDAAASINVSGGIGTLKDACVVEVRLDEGAWTEAAGTDDWTASIPLTDDPGAEDDHTVEYRVHTPLGTFQGPAAVVEGGEKGDGQDGGGDGDGGNTSDGGDGGTGGSDGASVNDTTPPTVSVNRPVDGAEVHGNVVIEGRAADAVGLTGVWVQVDGGEMMEARGTEEWTFLWDTDDLEEGTYTITVTVDDGVNRNSTTVEYNVVHPDDGTSGGASGRLGVLAAAILVVIVVVVAISLLISRSGKG